MDEDLEPLSAKTLAMVDRLRKKSRIRLEYNSSVTKLDGVNSGGSVKAEIFSGAAKPDATRSVGLRVKERERSREPARLPKPPEPLPKPSVPVRLPKPTEPARLPKAPEPAPTPKPPEPARALKPREVKPADKRRRSIIIERPKQRAETHVRVTSLAKGALVDVQNQQYIVDVEIGSGGSCVVYKAYDRQRKQDVALKVVDLSQTNPELNKSFENELQLLREMQGNHYVIDMYNYQLTKDKIYVVMEIGDINFKDYIKARTEKNRADDRTIRYYWTEMLKCVEVIHSLNIVHADLKPANFVLVKSMIKLIDFGIAARMMHGDMVVYRRSLQGTLNFISPEAVEYRSDEGCYEILLKSDVWSLGCILYALVYGEPPFGKIKNQDKKLLAIRDGKVEYPFVPRDAHLYDIMKLCLCKDINRRPTVEQLLEHPYVTGESTVTSLDMTFSLSPARTRDLLTQLQNTTPRTASRRLQEAYSQKYADKKVNQLFK